MRVSPPPKERTRARLARISNELFGQISAVQNQTEPAILKHRIDLGRQLFFDKRLSQSGEISCTTCHDLSAGGIDGMRLSTGHDVQEGRFNTPSVYNAVLQTSQFWDGRAKDLEEQAKIVILSPLEMAMPSEGHVEHALMRIPGYPALFRKAFPGQEEPVTFANTAKALAEFESGLLTPGRFDQFMEGKHDILSQSEVRGLAIFLDKGCAACHSGPGLGGMTLLLDSVYPFPDGVGFVPHLDELGRDFRFKVPTLRNVALTAPYLNDGTESNLAEALLKRTPFYTFGLRPMRTKVHFSDEKLVDILAFLRSLSGEADPEYLRRR